MLKPSRYHKNKMPHNWLVYIINDRCIDNYKHLYQGHLVDLGCGEASFKPYFLQHAESYTGVDWSDTLHKSNADVISDLNLKINLESESADTVVSLAVLEHLSEPQTFLNESFRILKNNGNLIMHVPWQWHIHEAPHDYFRFTPYGLKHLLTKAGYENIEIKPQAGFFTTLTVKCNYFLVRSIYNLHWAFKYPLALLCLPIWTLNQLLAPILDKLDREWASDTIGFMITAKKGTK